MISDAKKRKIGRELVDWIYLGIRTGARRSAQIYQQEKISNPTQAIAHIKRAVDMPNRARARINEWISVYDAENGIGTGQIFLGECLTLAGSVTLGEINAELTALEAQAQTVVDNVAGGWTWDQVASAIENQEWEAKDWAFPLPQGYVDVWGE